MAPKCLTFCVGAEVSLGHFGTSAEVSQHFMKGPRCPTRTLRHFGTGAEVSWTDRRRVHVLASLHHLTSHLHHPPRSSDSVSRHSVSQHFMKGCRMCLGQIGGAFLFLYRFTTSRHICTIHRDVVHGACMVPNCQTSALTLTLTLTLMSTKPNPNPSPGVLKVFESRSIFSLPPTLRGPQDYYTE